MSLNRVKKACVTPGTEDAFILMDPMKYYLSWKADSRLAVRSRMLGYMHNLYYPCLAELQNNWNEEKQVERNMFPNHTEEKEEEDYVNNILAILERSEPRSYWR